MKVKLEEVERYERHVKMRLAFRFGVITVTDGTQAVIRVRIVAARRAHQPGRRGRGAGRQVVREEPGIHRRPEPRPAPPVARHRHRALRAQGFDTPFGLFAGTYREQQKRGAALGLNPLVASYGPALLDRAILDALGTATGQSFAADDRAATCRASARPSLTPDIDGGRARAVPRRPEARPEHRRAPHGRPGRSADGGRSPGVGARQ